MKLPVTLTPLVLYSKTLNEVGFGTSWKSTTAKTAEVVFGVTAIPCTSTNDTLKFTVVPPLSLAFAVPTPVSFLIFVSILRFKLVIFLSEPADDTALVVYFTLWKPTPNLDTVFPVAETPVSKLPPESPDATCIFDVRVTVPSVPSAKSVAKVVIFVDAKFVP